MLVNSRDGHTVLSGLGSNVNTICSLNLTHTESSSVGNFPASRKREVKPPLAGVSLHFTLSMVYIHVLVHYWVICGFERVQCKFRFIIWSQLDFIIIINIARAHTWSEVFLLQVVRWESVGDEVSSHLRGTQILFIVFQSRRETSQNCTHLLLYLGTHVCRLTHTAEQK